MNKLRSKICKINAVKHKQKCTWNFQMAELHAQPVTAAYIIDLNVINYSTYHFIMGTDVWATTINTYERLGGRNEWGNMNI